MYRLGYQGGCSQSRMTMRLWLRPPDKFVRRAHLKEVLNRYISKTNKKSAKLFTQNLNLNCRVCMPLFYSVQGLSCPEFVLSRVCRAQGLSCPGFVCPGFVCPGFVCPGFVCPGFVCQGFVCQGYVGVSKYSIAMLPTAECRN
jgi:hypothetical protein